MPRKLLVAAAVALLAALIAWALSGSGAAPGPLATPGAGDPVRAPRVETRSEPAAARNGAGAGAGAGQQRAAVEAPRDAPGPARVRGVLLRAEDDRPIVGARVLLFAYRLSEGFERRRLTPAERLPRIAWTDANGRFEYELDDGGELRGTLVIHYTGYQVFQAPLHSIEPGDDVDLRRIRVRRAEGKSRGELLESALRRADASGEGAIFEQLMQVLERADRARERRGRDR